MWIVKLHLIVKVVLPGVVVAGFLSQFLRRENLRSHYRPALLETQLNHYCSLSVAGR